MTGAAAHSAGGPAAAAPSAPTTTIDPSEYGEPAGRHAAGSSGAVDSGREPVQVQEALLRQFIDALSFGVIIRRCDGPYEYANHTAAQWVGTTAEEMIGSERLQGGPADFILRVRSLDHQVAKTGQPIEVEEILPWRGRDKTVAIRKIPLYAATGELSHVGTVTTDVTEQRRLERGERELSEQRRQYLVLQRQFVSTVSHEFRTPLTAIQGAYFLIEKHLKRLPPEAAAPIVRLLRLQGEALGTLRELVDQVLLFNRFDETLSQAALRPVDVGMLLGRLARNCNETLRPPRVEWRDELPPAFRPECDALLLHSAVENLVSNGLKFSDAPKAVRVGAKADEHHWRIVVSDQGRGIPALELGRLGEPFFRSSNVGNVPGAGLGLTIAKRVAEALGGRLTIDSQEGLGTHATLHFPLRGAGASPR